MLDVGKRIVVKWVCEDYSEMQGGTLYLFSFSSSLVKVVTVSQSALVTADGNDT